MPEPKPDTDQLLESAAAGNSAAAQELLAHCRPRLRRMVAMRLDPSVKARLDPSDVVQEVLAEAFQKLPTYLKERPVSFYPWLRQIAWQRLVKLHRAHIATNRRSVRREDAGTLPLGNQSASQLADRLVTSETGPTQRAVRSELRQRVRTALDRLSDVDRELLVMRYLEHLTLKEIAETLEITVAATKMRHARALERLQTKLDGPS
jgi:RNA polymerase sigma-70 factor, ECF subfamily